MNRIKVYWDAVMGKWWVKVNSQDEPPPFRKKSQAVDQAVARAKEEKPSKLVIKTKKGKTSDVRKYGV